MTSEQKRRLCALAAAAIEQQERHFRPAWIRGTGGRVVEQVWRGMVGNLVICEVTLKWWDSTLAGVSAAERSVHVCQHLYQDERGRVRVHLVGWHLPLWQGWSGCARCGKGFGEQEVFVHDTSLQEF